MMLSKYLYEVSLKGVSASAKGPRISHLFFFADNNLLFLRVNMAKCNKVVLQAILMYAMSMFLFPKELCDDITKLIRAC